MMLKFIASLLLLSSCVTTAPIAPRQQCIAYSRETCIRMIDCSWRCNDYSPYGNALCKCKLTNEVLGDYTRFSVPHNAREGLE